MDQLTALELSPFREFSESEWARLRAGTPLTLHPEEIEALQGFNDRVEPGQVESIYLPLSRLLSMYVEATQELHDVTSRFLGHSDGKMPFIIGIAGSVAVGKSTTARLLQALLARWPSSPNVALVPTDGFLYPNAVLEAENLMHRKGFPESYDVASLIAFLTAVKSGKARATAPVYSHLLYDVVPGEYIVVARPDILIVEGLNVLQTGRLKSQSRGVPFVSDFFDFAIYLHADEKDLAAWYLNRFLRLKDTRFRDPRSYFHKYASLAGEQAVKVGRELWASINLVNLRENIGPTKLRADLILSKGHDHRIQKVLLRKV